MTTRENQILPSAEGLQTILIVDDDRALRSGIAGALERQGRVVITCSDIESAELILERMPVTHLLTDVQFSGPFGFEGLHLLTRLARSRFDLRLILMTGFGSTALRDAASAAGATAILEKPFAMEELEQILGQPRAAHAFEGIEVASVDEILESGALETFFQPIVALGADGGTPFGFEALTRIRGEWAGGGPAELFAYAQRRSRSFELNLAAAVNAIETAVALPPSSLIFINIDPPVFGDARLAGEILAAAKRAGISPERIVLEITERERLGVHGEVPPSLDLLRSHGIRFALDDHGSAFSHLSAISGIRPSFFKISHTFGTAFESDEVKRRVIRHVVHLARDFGCATVLEGIESPVTAGAAASEGVQLAQGYFFGRPERVASSPAAMV